MNGSESKNKDSVLVTLANRAFLDQAKQLFSSAYWNGGWKGDYLLLAHEDVPEEDLVWFRKKGIEVFMCRALTEKPIAGAKHPSVVLDKFYLFTPYFKQWNRVIFLDADIIVRASIERLANPKDALLATSANGTSLRDEFIKQKRENGRLFKELKKTYRLAGKAFNSGVMAFRTKIIREDAFDTLLNLYNRFGGLNRYGEEATFNLYFYKNWDMLPMLYNMYPHRAYYHFGIPHEELRGIIIHFVYENIEKPWIKSSPFYEEWNVNFQKADEIDISRPQSPAKTWTMREERAYLRKLSKGGISIFLKKAYRETLFAPYRFFHWTLGRVGKLIKAISPSLYRKLKNMRPA